MLSISAVPYVSMGCWEDRVERAISPLEGQDQILDGSYKNRKDAIHKCFLAANRRGFQVFAVQDGGWCVSSATAAETYSKYGEANGCAGGKGASGTNDVYRIKGD